MVGYLKVRVMGIHALISTRRDQRRFVVGYGPGDLVAPASV